MAGLCLRRVFVPALVALAVSSGSTAHSQVAAPSGATTVATGAGPVSAEQFNPNWLNFWGLQ
jgi:hypothetical protein